MACLAAGMTACSDQEAEESMEEETTAATVLQTEITQKETVFTTTTTSTESEETTTETSEETTVLEETTEMTSETTIAESTSVETTATTETAVTETQITTVITITESAAPETIPESTTTTTETVISQRFASGIWWASGADGDRYFCFYDDHTGSFRDQESGMGVDFTYDVNGTAFVFHIGDIAESHAIAKLFGDKKKAVYIHTVLIFADDKNAAVTWTDGSIEKFAYQGLGNFNTFRFYSNLELCEMALDYYEKQNHYRPGQAAADILENGSIQIQLYDNLGDHNSTSEWYTVDRFTGQGVDLLGNPVKLAE